jgi:hypothetical protein
MSGQRSDWRERLHANPSRMEQELAIELEDRIRYLTQVWNTKIRQFCVARLAIIPYFLRCSIASRILTGSHQQPRSHLSTVKQILSLTWTFRRFLGDFLGTLSDLASSSLLSNGLPNG